MATVAAKAIGFLSGNPQATTVTFVVASFTNAAITVAAYATSARTGTPVATRTINATSGASPKLAKYADDRGSADAAGQTWACYVGSSTITGLSAGTRYYLTLTQGSTVESDCETWTAPAAGSDFNVFLVSCDIGFKNLNDTTHDPGPGIWPAFRDIQERGGKPGFLVWTDDLGYADYLGSISADIIDDTGYTGKVMTDRPYNSSLGYDYALTYLALLGMLGNTAQTGPAWGRDEHRNWCLRCLPLAAQWGDHEIYDGIGSAGGPSTAYLQWGAASGAWDNLFGLLRPVPAGGDIRSLDTTARHWALDLGDLRIIAPDGITQASGGTSSSYPYSFATVFGTDQIDDVLNAATSTLPFKILAMGYNHDRTWQNLPVSTPMNPVVYYSQQPLSLMQPTEWKRLYFNDGQTPASLMGNAATNGATGIMFATHGDVHRPHVTRHWGYWDGDGPSDQLRADWTSIYFAPCTRAVGTVSAESYALVAENFHQGMQMLYRHPSDRAVGEGIDPLRDYTPSGLHVLVQGSLARKQITANLLQSKYGTEWDYRTVWTGTWRVGSNRPINVMCRDEGLVTA